MMRSILLLGSVLAAVPAHAQAPALVSSAPLASSSTASDTVVVARGDYVFRMSWTQVFQQLPNSQIAAAIGFTPLNPANNLSDVGSISTVRTNLGLGALATLGIGTGLSNVGGNLAVSYGTAAGTALQGSTLGAASGPAQLNASGFLSVAQGGTAAGTAAAARVSLGAAASGANTDITSLSAPALGAATAATAAVDTNTVQVATTQFVLAQAAAALPLVDGTAAAGTSTRYARADHVHPTDSTRAPVANPTFTGTVTAPALAVTGSVAQSAALIGPSGGAGAPTWRKPGVADVTGAAESGTNASITQLTGLSTPLTAAQGGTGNAGGAWATSAPAVSAASGTLTSGSGSLAVNKLGRSILLALKITVTTNGSGATAISVAMPYTAATDCVLAGRASAGKMLVGIWASGTATVNVFNFDNTYPGADGYALSLSGICQSTT